MEHEGTPVPASSAKPPTHFIQPDSSVAVSSIGDGVLRLALHGEFDHAQSLQVSEALDLGDRNGDVDVELDMSGVTFMDSTGIRLLILTRSAVHAAGHRLTITASSPTVYRVLELTGLVERFEVPEPVSDDPAPF